MLFKHHHRFYSVLQGGMDVAASFPKACDVLLGTPGVTLELSPNKRTESSNSNISKDSLTQTTFYVSRKCEHHTSHVTFFALIYTHMRGSSHVFVVRTSRVMFHPHALMWLF